MVPDLDPALIEQAIAKQPEAVRAFVRAVGPVIHGRVVKALSRRAARFKSRNIQQEIDDLTQEVFLALFAEDAKILRAWDPKRGPLGGFVALIADHQVFSIFRSGRRQPWSDHLDVLGDSEVFEAAGESPERHVASRQELDAVLVRLHAELTPLGFDVFVRLYVEDKSIETVCHELDMTAAALYAWRTRLGRLARKIASELDSELVSDPAGSERTPLSEPS